MSRHVRLDAEAEIELGAAILWYERQRRGLGRDLLVSFDDAVTLIADAPAACGRVPLVPEVLDVRQAFLKRFPYAVVFVELEAEIRIIALAHGRRRPGYWKDRI